MGTIAEARRHAELADLREPFAVAVVTRTEGSTLAKPGFRIFLDAAGQVVGGTLGGGCPEGPIAEVAIAAIRDRHPRLIRVHLVDTESSVRGTVTNSNPDEIYVQTNCGGTLEVFVEPTVPNDRLVVIGQGGKDPIEEALVRFGKWLGMEVIVVDPLPQLDEPPDVVVPTADVNAKALGLGPHDYVVVLTKGERDVKVLREVAEATPRFVGLLASRARLTKDTDELRAGGVAPAFLDALHAPIGLDIGAESPTELALSILADVVATKYGRHAPHKTAHPPVPPSGGTGR